MLTNRCVVIGCLLTDSHDTYCSMIVRFTSPATRGFLLPLLSLSCLVSSRRKKHLGPGYLALGSLIEISLNSMQEIASQTPSREWIPSSLKFTQIILSHVFRRNLRFLEASNSHSLSNGKEMEVYGPAAKARSYSPPPWVPVHLMEFQGDQGLSCPVQEMSMVCLYLLLLLVGPHCHLELGALLVN